MLEGEVGSGIDDSCVDMGRWAVAGVSFGPGGSFLWVGNGGSGRFIGFGGALSIRGMRNRELLIGG